MTFDPETLLDALDPPLALFIDFDGVLVEIASSPDAVTVDSDLPALLAHAAKAVDGAMAIVSGRPIAQIDALLGVGSFSIYGNHGAEFRHAGQEGGVDASVGQKAANLFLRLQEQFDQVEEIVIEPKPAGVAVHYRAAPEMERAVRAALEHAVADIGDFEVLSGKMVVEARPKGLSKAGAVEALMADAPFAGRKPVFFGDDVTDEDGMQAAIARAGYGVKVGQGETCAQHRLPDVASVHTVLRRIAGADRNDFASRWQTENAAEGSS